MKRLIHKSFLLGALLILATSCLDIQESIYMRNNGSGKFALTVNLEDLESLMELMAQVSGDQEAGKDFMDDADVNFDDLKKKLERQEGISQVKTIRENSDKLLGIAFEFSDVQALNKAIKELNKDENKDNAGQDYFTYRNGELIRLNTLGVKDQVQRKIETEIDISIDGVMLGNLLKDMTYTTKYTFEKPVKKTSNPGSKITNEGKTVTLTYHFFDDETATNSLGNNITF